MIHLEEPYQPRPIRFLELWQPNEWRIKVYGIAYKLPQPRPELIAAAKQITLDKGLVLAAEHPHFRIGFLGIHQGRRGNFVFFDYWTNENELCHHVFLSRSETPDKFFYATPTGLSACVWDLHLIYFERTAWLESILKNPKGPDVEEYLAKVLNEDV